MTTLMMIMIFLQSNLLPFKLSCVDEVEEPRVTTLVEDLPVLELKELTKHLCYCFLDYHEKYPIIISYCLSRAKGSNLAGIEKI